MSAATPLYAVSEPAQHRAPVLALDLATVTGWAVLSSGGVRASGTVSFKPRRFEGGGMRFLRFEQWLDGLGWTPCAVYFEEVRGHKGTDAAHIYGGLVAVLTTWCERRSVPYEGIPVGTIKRHATGKGNAGKPAMIEAARARGCNPQDDNEADAWLLLDYVLARAGGAAP